VSVSVTREITSDSPPGAVVDSPQAVSDTRTAEPRAIQRCVERFNMLYSIG
jgi:hypothetical protein